jgi:hypothetical protein
MRKLIVWSMMTPRLKHSSKTTRSDNKVGAKKAK